MKNHTLKDNELEVSSWAEAKHLWLTIKLAVKINGKELYQSPRRIEGLRSVVPFKINENGQTYNCELRSLAPASLLFTRYKIFIDGEEVDKGSLLTSNWYMFYGMITLGFIGLYFFGTSS